MPSTPFHFGPGFLLKSFLSKRFNFLAFVCSQVLIDVETAYNMIQRNARLHTFMHTYLGSLTVIPIGYFVVWVADKVVKIEDWNSKVIVAPLFAGAWSHVFFDSIMHSDVGPL